MQGTETHRVRAGARSRLRIRAPHLGRRCSSVSAPVRRTFGRILAMDRKTIDRRVLVRRRLANSRLRSRLPNPRRRFAALSKSPPAVARTDRANSSDTRERCDRARRSGNMRIRGHRHRRILFESARTRGPGAPRRRIDNNSVVQEAASLAGRSTDVRTNRRRNSESARDRSRRIYRRNPRPRVRISRT